MDVGGSPAVRFWRVTLEQQQDHLLAAGLLTQTELADSRALGEPRVSVAVSDNDVRVGTPAIDVTMRSTISYTME